MSLKYRPLIVFRVFALLVALALGSTLLQAVTLQKKRKSVHRAAPIKTVAMTVAPAPARPVAPVRPRPAKKVASSPWRSPDYADSTQGDNVDSEDLVVRRAAVDALGRLNGSIVVSDPNTGRVLSIVNQKLAFQGGFEPCSTVKVPVALAALSEGIVDRLTLIRVYGRTTFAMTEALARSNNQYFASLGQKLGFDRVSYYAKLFGLGEKASLDIDAEQPGSIAAAPPPIRNGGVGLMTSFGEGISLTPLGFAALMGAVANGGTLYYLQYPKTEEAREGLIPRVKRRLDIDQWVPEIKPGMAGAVEYGTARRIGFDPNEPIYGKTGTCTDWRKPTHLGWFGSFIDTGKGKLVVIVLLTGGRAVSGPAAAGVAGLVYKNLDAANYFAQLHTTPASPVAMISAQGAR